MLLIEHIITFIKAKMIFMLLIEHIITFIKLIINFA